jgi:hypothetical protein
VDARRLKVKTGRQATVAAAAYLAKYVGKAYEDEGTTSIGERRLHRYEVGQKFMPRRVDLADSDALVVGCDDDVIAELSHRFFGGRAPVFVWSSDMVGDEWEAPPVRVAFFDPPPSD